MAKSHSKLTEVEIATKDISPYCNTSRLSRRGDSHDTTGYGEDSHRKSPGLFDGTFSIGGWYDNTASVGPRNALQPLLNTIVACEYRLEGTGTGKPQDAFNALLVSYDEEAPIADYVKWSAELEIDGDVTSTTLS